MGDAREMGEPSVLDVMDDDRVRVRRTNSPSALRDWVEGHLWGMSGDRQWRWPLTVQFQEPLPDEMYCAIGRIVEKHPDVEVYAYGWADATLDWLRHMPAVEHLSINLARAESFDALTEVPRLRTLSLGRTLGPARSLEVLQSLQRLEELGIEGHARGFETVAALPRLRSLALHASRVRDLEALAGATRLELLRLSFGRVRDFTPLAGLPALRGIAIWQTRGMTTDDLAALAELPALEALDLGAMRTIETLAPLRGRPAGTLRYLLLEGMAGLRNYADIAALSALEGLGVWGAGAVDPDVAPLLAAPRLQALALEQRVPGAQVARLAAKFQGRDLLVAGDWIRRSERDVRVRWRAGIVDMLHASVHGRQWAGAGD